MGSYTVLIIIFAIVVWIMATLTWRLYKELTRTEEFRNRFKCYYEVVNNWLKNKNANKSIVDFFKRNDIKTIAVYGFGELGSRFYEEIRESEIKVEYFIDKNAAKTYLGIDNIPVVNLKEVLSQKNVDAIVVTPVFDYMSIEEDIERNGIKHKIISLEDIIYET